MTESRAVQSSSFDWPQRRVTVNLAPTNLRKVGSGLDLAIVVGFLVATKQLPQRATEGHGYLGELGLDGSVRSVPGVLPALDAFVGDLPVVALADLAEARLLRPDAVGVESLGQLVAVLRGEDRWPEPPRPTAVMLRPREQGPDRGAGARRGAGGARGRGGGRTSPAPVRSARRGKTMLAERLVGILPDLDERSAIEVSRVHSVASQLRAEHGLPTRPPFRSPHHTASLVAMVGGGSGMLRPGEISLVWVACSWTSWASSPSPTSRRSDSRSSRA